MFRKIFSGLRSHIHEHIGVYLTISAVVLVGICAGAFTINGLSTSQENELGDYIGGYLKILQNQNINSMDLILSALKNNLTIFILIFLSGMTIVGIPFVYFFIALNGYLTGFTIGVLVKILGYKGIFYAVATILPSEIFTLSALILMSVNAVIFSKTIIKNLRGKNLSRTDFKDRVISYLLLTGLYVIVLFIGILFEGYLSPLIAKLMVPVLV